MAGINFRQYTNVTKIRIPNKVTHNGDFSNKFNAMANLNSCAIPNNITNMNSIYINCYNLTGSPICGDNVFDMYNHMRRKENKYVMQK